MAAQRSLQGDDADLGRRETDALGSEETHRELDLVGGVQAASLSRKPGGGGEHAVRVRRDRQAQIDRRRASDSRLVQAVNARIAAVVFAAALVLDARSAHACSFPGAEPHVVDTTLEDSTLPEPPTDVSVLISRGREAQSEGCGSSSSSSCDDLGQIVLQLNEPASDDQSTPKKSAI